MVSQTWWEFNPLQQKDLSISFKHNMSQCSNSVTVYQFSRMLSTWMKGKSSPTAKLESQLTVPAIMNAAGLCDCWKNSPVRTNGIPPETAQQVRVLGHLLCQQLFHLQRWTCSVLHSAVTSAALQLSAHMHAGASEPVKCDLTKLQFRELTLLSSRPYFLLYIPSMMASR